MPSKDIFEPLTKMDRQILSYLVYLSKERHKRYGSFYCWPSQAHIAGRFGHVRPAVTASISKLVALGFLSRFRRRREADGTRRTNLYVPLGVARGFGQVMAAAAHQTGRIGNKIRDMKRRSPFHEQKPRPQRGKRSDGAALRAAVERMMRGFKDPAPNTS